MRSSVVLIVEQVVYCRSGMIAVRVVKSNGCFGPYRAYAGGANLFGIREVRWGLAIGQPLP